MTTVSITKQHIDRAADTLRRINAIESLQGGFVYFNGGDLGGGQWFPTLEAASHANDYGPKGDAYFERHGIQMVLVVMPRPDATRDEHRDRPWSMPSRERGAGRGSLAQLDALGPNHAQGADLFRKAVARLTVV